MRVAPKIVRNLKNAGWIIVGFMTAIYIYQLFFSLLGSASHEVYYSHYVLHFFRLTLIALVLGIVVAIADILFLSKVTLDFNFPIRLIAGTISYVVISLLVLLFFVICEEYLLLNHTGGFSLESRLERFFFGEFPVLVLYLTVVSFVINVFRLIIQRIGEKNFWNAVSGRYHIPHEEERVIMFLDLRASVYLAQKLGDRLYHELLHDIFNDITEPISIYGGEVYQYLGDGVVITWDMQSGTRQLNCIRCFYDILKCIDEHAGRYTERYQHIPKLKAGLHAGSLIAGEVGEEKREIVFHGDTVNTASRIQDQCVWLNEQILLSEELLFRFPVRQLKSFYTRFKGDISLKGKKNKISVYTIREADQEK